MKAIVVQEFGGPDVLQIETVPDPIAQAGEVVVKLHAAGVNPVETYQVAGTPPYNGALPFTPGSDGAGEIVEVGEGVERLERGRARLCLRAASGQRHLCRDDRL